MPSRPRLLIVVTLAEVGGAQTYVAALVPALSGSFDVTVAAHGPGPLADAVRRGGGRFISLSHVRRPVRPWRDLLGLIELIRICRRERPHILHANSSKAGVLGRLAARLTGVPVRVFTVHGWAFLAYSGVPAVAYRWMDRLAGAGTGTTICVSEHGRRAGIQAGTCDPETTVVIHNAVDVAAAPRAHPTHACGRIITVGRLKAPKDPLTLARALAALPPGSFRAAFVGGGPEHALLEQEISRLGLTEVVDLLGERSDVPELLAEADVFVLSSRSEGLPLSIVEAMAAGLPVVASAVGGVHELVTEETGILVPPEDPDALAQALDRLLGAPELRRRLGTAARSRAEAGFDLPAFGRAHAELYRGLLEVRGLPAP